MDVCHHCHQTITLDQPIALDNNPTKGRAWCKPCIDKIRARLVRAYRNVFPPPIVIRKVDEWPSAS